MKTSRIAPSARGAFQARGRGRGGGVHVSPQMDFIDAARPSALAARHKVGARWPGERRRRRRTLYREGSLISGAAGAAAVFLPPRGMRALGAGAGLQVLDGCFRT